MKSLDTNLLLRLLLGDIPKQSEAVSALFHDSSQGYAVADMAFAEIVRILQGLQYRYDRPRIAENLQTVIDIPQINCNRPMLERAIPLYVKHPKISFVDACLAAYAELNDATPLLTFDKRLVEAVPQTVANL